MNNNDVDSLKKRIAELEKLEAACKKAETDAEESAMRLSMVIEKVDEGITFSDRKGYFEIFNSKMEEITGYTMKEANSHKNFIDLLYPDPQGRRKALGRLNEAMSKGKVEDIETEIRTKNGTGKTLWVSTVMVDCKGEHMFLSVYRDITEHKKIDQMKDEFIGTISHELRTPLSITKEGISLVLDGIPGKVNAEQTKILKISKNNIDRLARIINSLIDISKIEAGTLTLKKEKLDFVKLARVVGGSFKPMMAEKNLKFDIDLPAGPIEICADEILMSQVIAGLLSNASKFTKEGVVKISIEENECEVVCLVSDSGIGMSKDNMSKIFNKFQQFGRVAGPGEKGTGLGLAIARGVVEKHGGRIWVESEINRGTKITFTLPKKA